MGLVARSRRRRLGASARVTFARRRLATARRPDVVVVAPPDGLVAEWDVPVVVRDGTTLRVNVFRPEVAGPVPVILSAHPYGKDAVPARSPSGRAPAPQYRVFPQPDRVRVSAYTSWEAPDPGFWVPHGYAVVNADARGGGTSEGTGRLFSDLEADDLEDLVNWAGTQPWSTGRVGLDGVSYLAISQYRVAARGPRHLAAVCPWEGFSDLYRDFVRPGGGREDGFSVLWSAMTRRSARIEGDLRREVRRRPERDAWYRERTPEVEAIDVPMLVCASFSDHCLHSRGSFEAFRRSRSDRRWLTTHRSGKWSTYYGDEAAAERLAFFDHALKDRDSGWSRRPPVLVRVHEQGPRPVATVAADAWPPADLAWEHLHLAPDGRLGPEPPARPDRTPVLLPRQVAAWTWVVPRDLDVIGPMHLELHASLEGATDATVFAVVRKLRLGTEVTFEGSYGYSLDAVSRGWQRVAHTDLDHELSSVGQPVHTHHRAVPLLPGIVRPVHVALLPHATRFRAGDELRVEVGGRWPFPRNPLLGPFPAGYRRSGRATLVVHTGPGAPSTLLLGTRPVDVGG